MPAVAATESIRRGSPLAATPRFSGPNASSASTVAPTICLAGSWRTVPTVRAMSRSLTSVVSWPSTRTVAGQLARVRMGDAAR